MEEYEFISVNPINYGGEEYVIQQLVCIGCVILGFALGGIIGFLCNRNKK